MKLKINRVIDYGTLESERVEISVIEDCELNYYLIVDTTYKSASKISNKIRHINWFSPKKVKKGDQIILHTKDGQNLITEINNGKNKRYTIFWGMRSSVWNNTGDAAVLIYTTAWKTTAVFAN